MDVPYTLTVIKLPPAEAEELVADIQAILGGRDWLEEVRTAPSGSELLVMATVRGMDAPSAEARLVDALQAVGIVTN